MASVLFLQLQTLLISIENQSSRRVQITEQVTLRLFIVQESGDTFFLLFTFVNALLLLLLQLNTIVSHNNAHSRRTYGFQQLHSLEKNILFQTNTPTREELIVSYNHDYQGRTYCFSQSRPLGKNLSFLTITPTREELIVSYKHAHSGRTYCF